MSCAFSKKIKHNSRITISGNYKFVINSPEVCFGIKRQCEKVGCKNLIILGNKKILCGSGRNGKHFYKHIYNITLCNFWHRS
jgi:hypothetical protein